MKVAECMEDDFMHKKVGTPQVSQLTMRVSIGNVAQTTSGPKRSHKRKWDKNPPKDKGTLIEKNHGMLLKFDVSTMTSWGTLLRTVKR